MVDLTLLPVTPIMGNGRAPLQPLEVGDAASRIAYVALTEPTRRPVQPLREGSGYDWARPKIDSGRQYTWRAYDAVGPETMTMLELMQNFAALNGRKLNPVFVDYRNFEMVLNVASLGNLNRQFVSLLRSEQDAERPIVGNPETFETLLGSDATLFKMRDALCARDEDGNKVQIKNTTLSGVPHPAVGVEQQEGDRTGDQPGPRDGGDVPVREEVRHRRELAVDSARRHDDAPHGGLRREHARGGGVQQVVGRRDGGDGVATSPRGRVLKEAREVRRFGSLLRVQSA